MENLDDDDDAPTVVDDNNTNALTIARLPIRGAAAWRATAPEEDELPPPLDLHSRSRDFKPRQPRSTSQQRAASLGMRSHGVTTRALSRARAYTQKPCIDKEKMKCSTHRSGDQVIDHFCISAPGLELRLGGRREHLGQTHHPDVAISVN